jgi:hypothetical protein
MQVETVSMTKRIHCTGKHRTAVAFAIFAILATAMLIIAYPLGSRSRTAALGTLASLQSLLDSAAGGSINLHRNDTGEIRKIRLHLKGSGLTVGNDFLESLTSLSSLRTLIVFHSEIDDGGLRSIRRMPQLQE